MKNNTPTEYEECVTLAEYLQVLKNQKKIAVYTHTPQETYTKSWSQKAKNKKQGVTKGIPDYVIVTSNKKVLFIEMKRKKGNKATKEQKEWIESLQGINGIIADVCYGFDEAKKLIDEAIKN